MGMQARMPLSRVVQLGGSGRLSQMMATPRTPPMTAAAVVDSGFLPCMLGAYLGRPLIGTTELHCRRLRMRLGPRLAPQ
jgi:hypothetical protein